MVRFLSSNFVFGVFYKIVDSEIKYKYVKFLKFLFFEKLFGVLDGILVFFLFCGKDFGF